MFFLKYLTTYSWHVTLNYGWSAAWCGFVDVAPPDASLEPTSCRQAGLCVVTFPKSGPDSVRTQMMGGLFGGAVDVVTVERCWQGWHRYERAVVAWQRVAAYSMGTGDYICVTLRGGAPWGFSLRQGEGDIYRPLLASQVFIYSFF